MLHKFIDIKQNYAKFHNNLLSQGRLPLKDTGIGFWSISTIDELYQLFRKLKLSENHHLIDLGSGDGRVVITASLFSKATGIEYDNELHNFAKELSKKLKGKLNNQVFLINKNFLDHPLKDYDFVFINPDKRFDDLEPKLMAELKGQLIVYGDEFKPSALEQVRKIYAGTTPVTIYKNPNNIN
jgi:protein-L-isoaspartate O-methyltransferase